MTMIEKVARAIAWSDIKDTEASFDLGTQERKYMRDITTQETMWVDPKYLPIARAAISAMREPTSAMLRPQVQKLIQSSDVAGIPGAATYEGATIAVADIWQYMIDAALSEK